MSYVRWQSAKRIHRVSLKKSGGGVSLDRVTKKYTPRAAPLTTICGELVPDNHEGIESVTVDEHNNALCLTCWNAKSPW